MYKANVRIGGKSLTIAIVDVYRITMGKVFRFLLSLTNCGLKKNKATVYSNYNTCLVHYINSMLSLNGELDGYQLHQRKVG